MLGGRIVVLIVDDEAFIRMLMAAHLQEAGFDVVEAMNATDAIDILAHDVSIDVVVTDVVMPGPYDGLDLARHLLQTRPEIPVVLVSGAGIRLDGDLRAVRYLAKPYEPRQLVAAVRGPVSGFVG